jgi:hypothetical protein
MRYQVKLGGLADRKVEVESSLFRGARVLVDGQPAPKGPKRAQFLVSGTDGRDSVLELKTKLPDPVPQVVWGGQTIKLEEPLKWYQWLWSGVPLLLLFVGGALGGASGWGCSDPECSNFAIRHEWNPAIRRHGICFSSLFRNVCSDCAHPSLGYSHQIASASP